MKRIVSLDIITGILIIHMIFGHIMRFAHCIDTDLYHYTSILLSFFMPWFFFKSGMFLHSDCLKTIESSLKSLILPLIKFSFLGLCIDICIKLFDKQDFNLGQYLIDNVRFLFWNGSFSSNQPLWFLLTLGVVRILGSYTLKISRKIGSIEQKVIFSLALFSLMIAYFLKGKIVPLTIQNSASGYFFFLMGYLLRDIQFKSLHGGALSLILYLIITFLCPVVVDMRGNSLEWGKYILWPFSALTGIVAINYWFKKLNVNSKILSYIGERSLIFYVWHWIPLVIFQFLNNRYLLINEQFVLLFVYSIVSICFLSIVDKIYSFSK